MAYNASRAPLSPPAPRPRKRVRSPQAYGAAACCASSSEHVAPFHDRRRWQNPAGSPHRVWQGFRAPHAPVPFRRWVHADEAATSTSGGDGCTIMSYNILADVHAGNHPDLYWDVPWDALRWDSRRRLILREIRHWDSDLVCLQEVDKFRDIAAEMKSRGYECIFKGRSSWEARDGCATFWKSERLRLLDEDSIDFSEFNLWNNVAQILVFELNGTQKFVIGNIHVLFKPKRGDVKLGQLTRPTPTPRRPTAYSLAAMAYNASRAPPAPRPRKRRRYPQASGAPAGCASSQYVAPFHDRCRQNPAGARRRVWEGFRAPHFRQWVFADDTSTSRGDAFTIMSYNILADIYTRLHSKLYPNVPRDALWWDSRRRLILREIRHWDSDLVCLQEVDKFLEIAAEMKSRGYECIFKGRSYGDGCATFWKSDRLRLLEEDSIAFSEFNLSNNVAQILVFELNGTQKFVIGNIHVLFKPEQGDEKLGQVRMLLEKANALAEKWDGIPVVLAGDFNATPDSAIYKFLSTKKLNISLHDKRKLSGTLDSSKSDLSDPDRWSAEEVRNATGYSNVMVAKHPLKLSSSYAMLKGNSRNRDHYGEPLATSYHKLFFGTVDYLWYTPGLECSRVLDTLPRGPLKRTRGLPTREMGSDHLPIVAEFVFTERTPDASEQEDESDEEDDESEEEDEEAEQDDDVPPQKASTAKHIYFSDSDDG